MKFLVAEFNAVEFSYKSYLTISVFIVQYNVPLEITNHWYVGLRRKGSFYFLSHRVYLFMDDTEYLCHYYLVSKSNSLRIVC